MKFKVFMTLDVDPEENVLSIDEEGQTESVQELRHLSPKSPFAPIKRVYLSTALCRRLEFPSAWNPKFPFRQRT